MHSSLYKGWVSHRRRAPAGHAFRYRLFMVYLDLAELPRVFDGSGRELAFRERPFQLGSARDCGTGQDLGCTQTRDGVFKPLFEHDLIVALALRSMSIGADVLLAFDAVSQPSQLFQ